jgi:predicted dehydrogenase
MKAAIIGAGLMGTWHADAARHAGVSICLVIDPDEIAGRKLAAKVGAQWSADMGRLPGSGATSAHVCSSSSKHAEHVTAVLAAGLHCISEKPVAQTETETRALFEHAERSGRVLCASHQFLFQPGTLRAIEQLATLGILRHSMTTCCTAGAGVDTQADDVIADIVTHPLSVLRRLIPHEFGDISWDALYAGPGEALVLAGLPTASHTILLSTHGRPTRNDMTIIGDRASCHIDFFHGFSTTESGEVSRARKAVRPFTGAASTLIAAAVSLSQRALTWEPAFPGLRELVRRYYAAIESGDATGPVTPSETIAVSAARDRILDRLGLRKIS